MKSKHENWPAAARARRVAPRLPGLRELDDLAAGPVAGHGTGDGAGSGQGARQAVIWLVPGVHRLHRVADAQLQPVAEELIFDFISLDYHHTLQAASGEAAEQARRQSMKDNAGKYMS